MATLVTIIYPWSKSNRDVRDEPYHSIPIASVGDDGSVGVDGDRLLLDPDLSLSRAVRRNPTGAPTFERQLGRREWQADDALEQREFDERRQAEWGWGEDDDVDEVVMADVVGLGRKERRERKGGDPVEEGDRKTR